jgi:hypothetical protein
MPLSKEELVDIGSRFRTDLLTSWSLEIEAISKTDLLELSTRGIDQKFLDAVSVQREKVLKLESEQESSKKDVPFSTSQRQVIVDSALDLRVEVKELAKVSFADDPDILALFRTGVKISGSIPKLIGELEYLLPLLKKYGKDLDPLSGEAKKESYISLLDRCEDILKKLKSAEQSHTVERKELPEKTAELYYERGVLYQMVKKIVRLARVEFRNEPAKKNRYNYDTLRRGIVAAKREEGKENQS